MARVTISGPTVKVTDPLLGGTPVAALKAWFDFAKGQKSVIATTQDGVSAIEVNSEDISMQPLLLSLSNGFTVEGAPVFIKMTPTQYAGDVPALLSNSTYVDEEGAEIRRTWAEWKDDVHEHMDADDGDKIVPGNSFGFELPSGDLVILLQGGYTLMLNHEVAQWVTTEIENPPLPPVEV